MTTCLAFWKVKKEKGMSLRELIRLIRLKVNEESIMSKHRIRVLCFDNKRALLSQYTVIWIDFKWEGEGKERDKQWKIIRVIKTGDKMNTNSLRDKFYFIISNYLYITHHYFLPKKISINGSAINFVTL